MIPKKVCCWEKIPAIFDIKYASILLDFSDKYLEKLCRQGQIPAFKVGKCWRFDKDVFKLWIEEQKNRTVQTSKTKSCKED